MGKNEFHRAFLLVLINVFLFSPIAFSAPGVFRDFALETAKNTAKQEGKFLVLDFTASWCGPCHRMERETWSNAEVQKWINENAIAIQIDVDKEKDLSASFKIAAMPSVVIFQPKDYGKEFDRHVGYQSSTDILQWFAAVKRGESQLDVLRHDVENLAGKGGKLEIEGRRKYGRACLEAGNYEPALEQYVWLWQHIAMEDPSAMPLRSSYLAAEIAGLVAKSEPARVRFRQFRDAAEKNEPLDYVVLNEVLGDQEKTIDWFEKIKKEPNESEHLRKASFRLERLLISKGRWADLTFLYPNPSEELKLRVEVAKEGVAALSSMGVKIPYDPFCPDAARLYAAYLAAHRESEAKKIAAECLKISDTPFMRKQLVVTALQAKQPRKEQLKWTVDDKELAAKLEEALKQPKQKPSK